MRSPPQLTGTCPRRDLPGAVLALLAMFVLLPATSAAAKPKVGDGVGGVELRKLGDFDTPVHVDNAPGSGRLLFVVEQPGAIRVLRGAKTVRHPFLDIGDEVEFGGEQGLLSVAFPPNYKRSGRFYVYYTVRGGEVNRLSEFERTTATSADPASERPVIEFSHPEFSNHNGGQLQFGPDGYLYIGTGDGGGAGDTRGNAQNRDSPLGKLLRVDPRPGNAGGHGIPPGNPFAGSVPGVDEIYSLGLRNPWRFSFDRETGRIAIGDVGQGQWEEIDYGTLGGVRGANFGWNVFEGNHRFEGSTPPAGYAPPIHEYSHGGGRCAVVGGYVVRDRKLKSLYGRYLYSDLCRGELRSFVPSLERARRDRPLGLDVPSPTSFGEGVKGQIYVASGGGGVWRVRKPRRASPGEG
jgi:glucose/arabinose dehydrogenase